MLDDVRPGTGFDASGSIRLGLKRVASADALLSFPATSSPATSRTESEPEAHPPVKAAAAAKPKAGQRTVPPARFACSAQAVLDALSVDPMRQWTVAEIGDLLLAETSAQRMSVHRCVTAMLKQGALALAHVGDGTKKNPRKVALLSAAPASASTPPPLPPTPQAGCHYLVLDEFTRITWSPSAVSARQYASCCGSARSMSMGSRSMCASSQRTIERGTAHTL